tara:strand:+ start:1198 stop:1530 length:333 start_codon:yes stop_codon:yes gene_type:complete
VKPQLGNFKEKIKIKQVVKSKDALGSPVENISVLKSLWSQRVDVSGSYEDEGKIRVLFDASFFVKYDRSLMTGQYANMIVEDENGFDFKIESVIEVEFRKFLRINTVKSE